MLECAFSILVEDSATHKYGYVLRELLSSREHLYITQNVTSH